MDCVRIMGGAKLAVDFDRTWDPADKGDVVRGRYGRTEPPQIGETGDEGAGSVERRSVGGFRPDSKKSGGVRSDELCKRELGRGVGWNSSRLSVSGSGSIVVEVASMSCRVL
jgi:hypothetical protein